MTPARKTVADMTRGERVCAFIEDFCVVPEGDLVGQLMKLEDFQRAWLLEVYDNPAGTRLAILSIGKKNGKTPLIAALVLAHVAGPEARTNSQIVSGAMSQTQAATVFKYARKMVQASPKLQALVRVQPSLKQLQGLAANVEYRAISRQKKTAHGIAPVLAIIDELGQVKGPQDDFVEAIETALGAYDDSMLIIISTQAASDADLLSTWIDDQILNPSPTTVCHVHTAKAADCDVLDEVAWRESNPALGIFRSEKDLRTLAQKASRMPSFEASFRNLNLNQRVAQERLAFAPSVWRHGAGPINRALFTDGRPVHVGLDLSARTDLTAAVAATADDEDNVHLLPICYTPLTGLEDRARRDRAPYDVWVKARQLRAVPGSSIDYDWVCSDLLIAFLGMNIVSVQFDPVAHRRAQGRGRAHAVRPHGWRMGRGRPGLQGSIAADRGVRVGLDGRQGAPRWPPVADDGRGERDRRHRSGRRAQA